ncbi:MAG: hypothetical protein R3F55_03265 [Alphaproteobacteria bacterium]
MFVLSWLWHESRGKRRRERNIPYSAGALDLRGPDRRSQWFAETPAAATAR